MRNVALAAMEIATLDRAYPGRMRVGVGHGVQDWMAQIGEKVASPMTLLREYVTVLSALLRGERVTYDGRYVKITDVSLDWPPESKIELLLGAEKPRTLALSGELGSGTVITGGTSPDGLRDALQHIAAGYANSDAIERHSTVVYVICATGPDAARQVRDELAYWQLDASQDLAAYGTAEEIAAAATRWIDAGADTIVFQPPADVDVEEFVGVIGRDVQPLIATFDRWHARIDGHRPDTDSGYGLRPHRGRGQLAGPHRPGHVVVFSTESGRPGAADDIMVSGRGLDVWSRVPGLNRVVVVGRFLRANRDARAAYAQMLESTEYRHPVAWTDATPRRRRRFTASRGPPRARDAQLHRQRDLAGPGGRSVQARHARRRDLPWCAPRGSIRRRIDRPLGALRPQDHRAHVGFGTTGVADRPLTRFWDPDYYRTYSEKPGDPVGYMSVEAEVTRALENPDDFRNVPTDSPHRRTQTSGMARDTATDSRPAFVVDDGNYISARWPGDTHTFATAVSARLHEKP